MKRTFGIDEVGRGALAGPVVVAVVALPKGFKAKDAKLGELRDSKKLSAKKREAWAGYLKDRPDFCCALARVYPRQIEKHNISRAANMAAERAFWRLSKNTYIAGAAGTRAYASKTAVFLDGGLFLGNGGHTPGITAKTVVKGDETIPAITVASIVAKVHRDRMMVRLGKKYPAYGFEVHKGYGTYAHRAAIKKHGPSDAHRLTFLKKSPIIKPQSHGRRTGKASHKR